MFSGLRVYALWNGSRLKYLLAGAIITLGCVPIATNIVGHLVTSVMHEFDALQFQWTRVQAEYINPPISACIDAVNVSDKTNVM